jgi:hypothetical protein
MCRNPSIIDRIWKLFEGNESRGFDPWLSQMLRCGTLPFYEVLYAPSFHRTCGVSVVEWPEGAEVSLERYVGNLSAPDLEQIQKGGWPAGLELWQEAGRADPPRIDRYHKRLPASIPLLPGNSRGAGCDGMIVYCWFGWDSRIGTTMSWQDHEPATFQLARAVHRLASEVLHEPTSLEALREIGRYLA